MPLNASEFDVIVVGVGTMGSAACHHLARRGASVLGIDQGSIPNPLAAHAGHSRMFRLAYFEHPDYVPLLRRSLELWRALEAEAGVDLYHETGGLYVGQAHDPFVAGSLRSAKDHGLPHEALSGAAIRERFPQFVLPDDFVGIYEPKAGPVAAEETVRAQAQCARDHGAELHEHETVLSVTSGRVRTDRAEYRARHIIITQGPWAARHGVADGDPSTTGGVPLNVTRQILGWVDPVNPERLTADVFPSFAISLPDGSAHYGFPIIPALCPHGRFKIAHHWHDQPTDPTTVNRAIEPTDEADFRQALAAHLPDANGPLADIRICMYTNTPDGHFVVDQHPSLEGVTIACGFSGHGFKFAPVMGEVLADLALDGQTGHPIDFLRLARFR